METDHVPSTLDSGVGSSPPQSELQQYSVIAETSLVNLHDVGFTTPELQQYSVIAETSRNPTPELEVQESGIVGETEKLGSGHGNVTSHVNRIVGETEKLGSGHGNVTSHVNQQLEGEGSRRRNAPLVDNDDDFQPTRRRF